MDAGGRIAAPGDLVAQFSQALANLQAVVAAAGGQMTDIVKLTLFVTDAAAYRALLSPLGAAYRAVFGRYYPAMTLVEVRGLFDPQALIEIEGLAVLPEG
jgi:enamine deaminase RidA (YjgF/YER057c/UK114 family)